MLSELIQTLKAIQEEEKDSLCSIHDKICEAFCDDCETPVCIMCICSDHKTHEFEFIPNTHKKILEEIKSTKESLLSKIDTLNNDKTALKRNIKTNSEILSKIKSVLDEFSALIEQYRKDMEDMEGVSLDILQKCTEQIDQGNDLLTSLAKLESTPKSSQ